MWQSCLGPSWQQEFKANIKLINYRFWYDDTWIPIAKWHNVGLYTYIFYLLEHISSGDKRKWESTSSNVPKNRSPIMSHTPITCPVSKQYSGLDDTTYQMMNDDRSTTATVCLLPASNWSDCMKGNNEAVLLIVVTVSWFYWLELPHPRYLRPVSNTVEIYGRDRTLDVKIIFGQRTTFV